MRLRVGLVLVAFGLIFEEGITFTIGVFLLAWAYFVRRSVEQEVTLLMRGLPDLREAERDPHLRAYHRLARQQPPPTGQVLLPRVTVEIERDVQADFQMIIEQHQQRSR